MTKPTTGIMDHGPSTLSDNDQASPTLDENKIEDGLKTDHRTVPRKIKWWPGIPKMSMRRIDKTFSKIFSIATRGVASLLVILLVIVVYRDLSDKNYSIDQVTVPQLLNEAGYTGPVVANRIFRRVNSIIHSERLADVAGEYKNANSAVDLNVELVGVGVPVRSLSTMLRGALGLDNRKTISGAMSLDGDTLVFELTIDGETEKFYTPLQAGIENAITGIIDRSAETILKHSNPYVLARHYLLRDSDGCFRLGRYILSKHQDNPDIEPIGFFAVAGGYLTEKDFESAEKVARAGTEKYKDDLNLHAALGTMLHRLKKYDEAKAQCKKIISMLDDNTPVNRISRSYLNLGFLMADLQKRDSAIFYAKQAIAVDRDFLEAYVFLGEEFLKQKDTTEAFNLWSTAFQKGLRARDYRRMLSSHSELFKNPRVIQLMSNAHDY